MKVYILVKEAGSYSDYSMANIAAYLDVDTAEAAKSKAEEDCDTIRRARSECFTYIREWVKLNPTPEIPSYRSTEYKAARAVYNNWEGLRREEEYRFYNSLDYLTTQQKLDLVNPKVYFETDASYSIQELEVIE